MLSPAPLSLQAVHVPLPDKQPSRTSSGLIHPVYTIDLVIPLHRLTRYGIDLDDRSGDGCLRVQTDGFKIYARFGGVEAIYDAGAVVVTSVEGKHGAKVVKRLVSTVTMEVPTGFWRRSSGTMELSEGPGAMRLVSVEAGAEMTVRWGG